MGGNGCVYFPDKRLLCEITVYVIPFDYGGLNFFAGKGRNHIIGIGLWDRSVIDQVLFLIQADLSVESDIAVKRQIRDQT